MDSGKLFPDSLLIDIIKDRLAKPDVKAGWMLDGYPRTIPQAEALDKILQALGQKIDVVLNVDVPDAELIKRVTGRRMRKCGTTYQVQFNRQKLPASAMRAALTTRGRTIPRRRSRRDFRLTTLRPSP